ncbi:pyridoxamine 5'-phosphate oxidase family protein [Tissierella pigra]|uniref:pyridoxamine 5'-phosphate oxidase family protein n=1 Tax=Tissierella pigra TaxID=2607614 RepID=UPI001C110370|nr:pyridoxamine 5'-phosphate oxidase family protein [Tissierella pigra]MBU5427633.1 pyridoxamine 5'-phosphate oxidase family protein [Tissierella pigra]
MNTHEKAIEVMKELFAKDCQFSMATVKDNVPSVRVVDTFYEDNSFYVVTYSKTQKVQELKNNSPVALCNEFYRFSGNGYNIGYPLLTENKEIREKLIKVFEPWYFAHNNENDEDMCYVRIELNEGFFYKDGVGYKVNFKTKEAKQFPFDIDPVL